MATELEDHNEGQKDGAQATFLDSLAVEWNPFISTAYKQGFRHGLQHQPEKKAPEEPRIHKSSEAGADGDDEEMPWFLKLIIAFYLLILSGIFLFLRWTIQRPWRVAVLLLLAGAIALILRQGQPRPTVQREAPGAASQSVVSDSPSVARQPNDGGDHSAGSRRSSVDPTLDLQSPGRQAQAPLGSSVYEAEQASLNGAARLCTDHSGFSGTAFVCGYGPEGAGNSTTTFQVQVPSAGEFVVSLRYANNNSQAMTLSIYVNGVKARSTVLQPLPTWDSWSEQDEVLTLVSGTNEISYRYDVSDSGHVNLDQIRIGPR